MSSSSSKLVCVRLVVLVGVLGFLIMGSHGNREASGRILEGVPAAVNNVMININSKRKVNYISKRKVPNGPDPIHNRGAGKSHRPPGHA